MAQKRFKRAVFKEIFFIATHLSKARRMIKRTDKYTSEDRAQFAREIMSRMRKAAKTHSLVYGMDNLPTEGGFIMYSNHQGKYDGIGIIESFGKPCRALWKRETADYIVARECCGLIEAKTIDVEKEPLATLRTINEIAKEVREEGRIYLIFPEGGYDNNKNTLQDFKHGCFRCSLRSKAPIVPICIYDSWKAMDQDSSKDWVTTQIHYLEPIPYDEYKSLSEKELADLVKVKIQARLDLIESGADFGTPSKIL